MLRAPSPHPFLAARAGGPADSADAAILGVAADGGVSFRPGAAMGPEGIRRFSESIESFSPRAGRDLEDLRVVDLGDYVGEPAGAEATVKELLAAFTRGCPLLAVLGGDHSVTPPVVRAMAGVSEDLALIGFDAHLDLREDYPGDHACTYRRVAETGVPCVVLGPRSGARHEWEDVPKVLEHCARDLVLPRDVRRRLEGRDVYVTVDVDVLDPSVAPGTGNPEPGGPSFNELLEALESLEGLDVVGFDLVEVSPPLDSSGITQAAGALLVREMLLRFARP